jgi:peptidoglycan/LPS O-acetylase OafA/YrhL
MEIKILNKNYRPDIDGLRAVAVISVVVFHAFPDWIKGGFIGVDVFFVISGYLISRIIIENLDNDSFKFPEFYYKRIKRIFPSLLIVLIACYAFGWFALLPDEYKQLGKHIAGGVGFISNFILWGEEGYFDNSAATKPLLHLWSLGIEEQFYIVWPFILWLAWKRKCNILWVTFLVIFISYWCNNEQVKESNVAAFYSPITRFWELLAGSMIASLEIYKKERVGKYQNIFEKYFFGLLNIDKVDGPNVKRNNIISLIGVLILGYGLFNISKEDGFPGKWAVIPVLATVMIIGAGPIAVFNKYVLSNKVLVWIGLVSFPMYLWHWPLLSFARIIEGETPSFKIRLACVVIAMVLAWLTYKIVENPIRSSSNEYVVPVLVVLLIIVGYIGYNAYDGNGMNFRKNIKIIQTQTEDLNFNFERMNGWLCDKLTYKDSRCYYTGVNPSVVVIGDSHAPSIYSGLRGFYSSQNKDIAIFGGGGGCPPLLNVVSKDNSGKDNRECILRTSESINTIIDTPSVKEVIIISRGPLYTTSQGFGNFEGDKYGEWVLHYENEKQGIRSNSEVFFEALGYTFDKLILSGKKVTYLHDVPELGFDIRACLAKRPLSFGGKVKNPCAVSRDLFEERNKEFRAQVKNVLDSRPSIKIIDLSEALCDKKYCYGGKDGILFYMDDDHLSHRGSEYVVKRLWDKFNDNMKLDK